MNKMNEQTFHVGIKAVIINSNTRILLLKRLNANLKKEGNSYWDLPGGKIKEGEGEIQAFRREIEEKTGIVTLHDVKHLIMMCSNIKITLEKGNQ